MSKEIFISSTPHETRLAIVEDEALTEIYYERENEYTLAGSIYNGRVTRVLPGMQSSFVEIGLERDAFLYITDFMEEAPDSEEFDTTPAGDRAARAPRLGNGEQPTADAGGRGVAAEDGAADATAIATAMPSVREAPTQRQSSRTVGAARPETTTPTVRPPESSTKAPRLARALPAPMEAAAGGDGGDGVAGAAHPARQAIRRARRAMRRRRTPQRATPRPRATPRYRVTATTTRRSGASPRMRSTARPACAPLLLPTAARRARAAATMHERMARGPRGDRGRRDGGRNRDGQRRDGQRQDQRPQRFPRGFEPSRNLYGVDSGETSGTGPIANAYPDEIEAGAEPIILPGESLSKYRKGGEEQAAPKSTESSSGTLAPPANLYTLAAGWDGGATLPGETLSRRSPSESRPDARHDSRSDPREGRNRSSRDFERGPRRDSRPGRNDRNARGRGPARQPRRAAQRRSHWRRRCRCRHLSARLPTLLARRRDCSGIQSAERS